MAKRATGSRPAASKPAAGKAKSSHSPAKEAAAEKLLAQLEKTDGELLRLLNRRTKLAADLRAACQGDDAPPVRLPTEDEQLRSLVELSEGPMPAANLRAIFQELFASGRSLNRPTRVAFLGPEYSYSHLATLERFGHHTQLVSVMSIGAVFEAVNRGDVEYGLVPLENSTDGRIVDTLEMFTRLPIRICGEVQLRIHHYLLSKCPRSEVTQVYSRPQALSQCRDWLSRHMPAARAIPVTSTAAAAELARDKPGTAAIASRQAGVHYGLDILASRIEDNRGNLTRFAVIGHDSGHPSGNDKTALMFQVAHQPGALADAMGIFKRNDLNLTWIESFPIPNQREGYLFFVEFEGHESEPAAQKAVESLMKKALRLEVLGSYPRSEPPAEDEEAV